MNWCGQQGVIYSVSTISIRQEGGGEIPPAGGRRYLGALPGGPGNHATAQRPDGRSGRFGIRRPRASSRPPHTKTARRLRARLLLVAERARFELAIPFWGTHAFQACLFSHSSISPIGVHTLSRRASSATRASLQYVSGAFRSKPDCKGNHFFRKCKYRRGNFSTRGYKVRLWSMQPGYSSG